MACAGTEDSLAFVAAALSAMTSKETVTKSKYDVIRTRALSGTDTGYVFKGRLDVPQAIEQTYSNTFKLFVDKDPPKEQPINLIVRKEIERTITRREPVRREAPPEEPLNGYFGSIFKVAAGAVAGTVTAGAILATAPVSVPVLFGAAVVGAGATAGGLVFTAGDINSESGRTDTSSNPVQVITTCSDGGERFMSMPSNKSTIRHLKLRIQEIQGISPEDQFLSFQGRLLDDSRTLASYKITDNSVIKLCVKVRGGSCELHYIDNTYLHPTWDYDFTDIDDGNTEFKRGGFKYYRPCGWKRIAINVSGKYPDGDAWLGHTGSAGEWAVSYHGTSKDVFNKICDEGYKIGTVNAYGRGVYSTPFIDETIRYATKFEYNGAMYYGIFQNRVNPKGVNIVNDGKYWYCPNEKDIRPYGLCLKKAN